MKKRIKHHYKIQTMKVGLYKRHYGIHKLIKEVEIEGTFRRYGAWIGNDYVIDEERLLKSLPTGFLKTSPHEILITVKDSEYGATAVSGLKLFRPWAKYFDSYSLQLVKSNKK